MGRDDSMWVVIVTVIIFAFIYKVADYCGAPFWTTAAALGATLIAAVVVALAWRYDFASGLQAIATAMPVIWWRWWPVLEAGAYNSHRLPGAANRSPWQGILDTSPPPVFEELPRWVGYTEVGVLIALIAFAVWTWWPKSRRWA